ncbi:hypothetical protein ACTA71_009076 [Dictyostelium dimigraforme]
MLKRIQREIGGYVKRETRKREEQQNILWIVDGQNEIENIMGIFHDYPPITMQKKYQLEFLKENLKRQDFISNFAKQGRKLITTGSKLFQYNNETSRFQEIGTSNIEGSTIEDLLRSSPLSLCLINGSNICNICGILLLLCNNEQENTFLDYVYWKVKTNEPILWLNNSPVRIYLDSAAMRKQIIAESAKRAVIYQWYNLQTGAIYVGSAIYGAKRLRNYWTPSFLERICPIVLNLNFFKKENFALAILEDLGGTSEITKEILLAREQYYIDLVFQLDVEKRLNQAVTAGSTLGYKYTEKFKANRRGILNPMYNREKSPEFIYQQTRDKSGSNNPRYGVTMTAETIKKLIKKIYVYDAVTKAYVGEYSTIKLMKVYKVDSRTIKKKFGQPYKIFIFSDIKLIF